jgi:hypothetical protein
MTLVFLSSSVFKIKSCSNANLDNSMCFAEIFLDKIFEIVVLPVPGTPAMRITDFLMA